MPEPLRIVQTEPTAVSVYCEYSSGFVPSVFQQDLMEQTVTDLNIWREAVVWWFGNDYRAKSIKSMLDYYEQLMGKRVSRFDKTSVCKQCGRVGCLGGNECYEARFR